MIRVGLLGRSGRMGAQITRLLESEFADRARLAASASQGERFDGLFDCDVIIDFSLPEAAALAAHQALKEKRTGAAWVIGSTGWKPEHRRELEALARETPVLMSSNFSTGVLALAEILKQASPLLARLGYTPVLVEAHHQHKKDAPSGTAVMLQRVVNPQKPDSIQTHSVRAGEVIGDHELTFFSPGDQIRIGHFAQDRSIFARGAIEAALWLAQSKEKRREGTSGGSILSLETFFREKFLQA